MKILTKFTKKTSSYLLKVILKKKCTYLNDNNIATKYCISGKTIEVFNFQEINSTHLYAKSILSNNNPDESDKITVILANSQSNGIGQGSNQWLSPIGNFYASLILKIKTNINKDLLTIISVLCIVKAISSYGSNENIRIKWINDVYINNRKLGGILLSVDNLNNLIISIGINLLSSPTSDSICLKEILDINIEPQKLLKKLLEQIILHVELYKDFNKHEALVREIEHYLLYLNEKVDIWNSNYSEILASGNFIGIDYKGRAVLTGKSGEILTINEGRMKPYNNK